MPKKSTAAVVDAANAGDEESGDVFVSYNPELVKEAPHVCPGCNKPVWHFHKRSGLCRECEQAAKQPAPVGPVVPESPPLAIGRRVYHVELKSVRPGPFQVRSDFSESALQELASSIQMHGVIQPIVVRRSSNFGTYELIAGERRWRASQLAGAETIPVIVRDCSDDEAAEFGILENVHRQQLNAIEEARAYRLLNERGKSQADIGRLMGKTQSAVANTIRLLKLPEPVQDLIAAGKLSAAHGVQLLRWTDFPAICEEIARLAAEKGAPVRMLEEPIPFMWDLIHRGLLRVFGNGVCDIAEFQQCQECPFGAARQPWSGGRVCLKPEHYAELESASMARLQQEHKARWDRIQADDEARKREEEALRSEELAAQREASAALQGVTAPPAVDEDARLKVLTLLGAGPADVGRLRAAAGCASWTEIVDLLDAMDADGLICKSAERNCYELREPAPGSSTVIDGHPAQPAPHANDHAHSHANSHVSEHVAETAPVPHPSSTKTAPGPDPVRERWQALVEFLDQPGRTVTVDARQLVIACAVASVDLYVNEAEGSAFQEIARSIPDDADESMREKLWLDGMLARAADALREIAGELISVDLYANEGHISAWLESLPDEEAEEVITIEPDELRAMAEIIRETTQERDTLKLQVKELLNQLERKSAPARMDLGDLEKQVRVHQAHANEQHAAADKLKGEVLQLRSERNSLEGKLKCATEVIEKLTERLAAMEDAAHAVPVEPSPNANGHHSNGNSSASLKQNPVPLSGEEQLIIRTLESAGGECSIGTVSNALGMDVSRYPGKRTIENLVRRGLVERRSDNVLALVTAELPA